MMTSDLQNNSMSHPELFVPSYGRKSNGEVATAGKGMRKPALSSGEAMKAKGSRRLAMEPAVSKRSLLPKLIFNGNIEYLQDMGPAIKAAQGIGTARPGIMGFDLEWRVSYVQGEAPRRTATLQLCAPACPSGAQDSPVWETAFIFHLCHMHSPRASVDGTNSYTKMNRGTFGEMDTPSCRSIPPAHESDSKNGDGDNAITTAGVHLDEFVLPESLVRVLCDPDILLAGVGIGGDVARLEREYKQLRECGGIKGMVDLSELAKRKVAPDRRRRGMWSLADLTAEMMGLQLVKPQALRSGDWERRPLSVDQLEYAARDAYAGMRLWQVMSAMPDLLLQRSATNGDRPPPSGIVGGETWRQDQQLDRADAERRQGKVDGARTMNVNRLSFAKLETHRLWHEDGLSVEAVAEARCNKSSTVLGYIAECVEAGLPYDWSRLNMDSDMERAIVQALFAATDPAMSQAEEGHTPMRVQETRKCSEVDLKEGSETTSKHARKADLANAASHHTVVREDHIVYSSTGDDDGGASKLMGNRASATSSVLARAVADARAGGEEMGERWNSVRLKVVKELAPRCVEYWQIKMVLGRLKSGWPGYIRHNACP